MCALAVLECFTCCLRCLKAESPFFGSLRGSCRAECESIFSTSLVFTPKETSKHVQIAYNYIKNK